MVNLDHAILNMNFWIETLPTERRALFFHWLEEHAHILGDGLVLDSRLDNRFRNWLERLPEEVQERELFIILSEIAWVGLFHDKVHPYIKLPARLAL